MKKKFIDYYMNIAEITAKLSYAERLKVGAVIVKENQILATGYNGMPAGWENKCENKEWMTDAGGWLDYDQIVEQWPNTETNEDGKYLGRYRLKTKPEVLHSEMNALMKVCASNESTKDAIIFTTHAPCIDCAKAIYQAGIKRVIYGEEYRSNDGLNFLKTCGVNVIKYTKDDK